VCVRIRGASEIGESRKVALGHGRSCSARDEEVDASLLKMVVGCPVISGRRGPVAHRVSDQAHGVSH